MTRAPIRRLCRSLLKSRRDRRYRIVQALKVRRSPAHIVLERVIWSKVFRGIIEHCRRLKKFEQIVQAIKPPAVKMLTNDEASNSVPISLEPIMNISKLSIHNNLAPLPNELDSMKILGKAKDDN